MQRHLLDFVDFWAAGRLGMMKGVVLMGKVVGKRNNMSIRIIGKNVGGSD